MVKCVGFNHPYFLQSVVCTVVRTLLGYVHPTDASPFLTDRGGLPPIPAPASVRKRVHPLVSLALLQSSSCLRRPGVATGRLPWGLEPLRDISLASPRPMGIPGPPLFRPQRFTRSRRLAPRTALQTCFILLPRPGFPLQGVPPPT
jgi:hypothetical protein